MARSRQPLSPILRKAHRRCHRPGGMMPRSGLGPECLVLVHRRRSTSMWTSLESGNGIYRFAPTTSRDSWPDPDHRRPPDGDLMVLVLGNIAAASHQLHLRRRPGPSQRDRQQGQQLCPGARTNITPLAHVVSHSDAPSGRQPRGCWPRRPSTIPLGPSSWPPMTAASTPTIPKRRRCRWPGTSGSPPSRRASWRTWGTFSSTPPDRHRLGLRGAGWDRQLQRSAGGNGRTAELVGQADSSPACCPRSARPRLLDHRDVDAAAGWCYSCCDGRPSPRPMICDGALSTTISNSAISAPWGAGLVGHS